MNPSWIHWVGLITSQWWNAPVDDHTFIPWAFWRTFHIQRWSEQNYSLNFSSLPKISVASSSGLGSCFGRLSYLQMYTHWNASCWLFILHIILSCLSLDTLNTDNPDDTPGKLRPEKGKAEGTGQLRQMRHLLISPSQNVTSLKIEIFFLTLFSFCATAVKCRFFYLPQSASTY